MVSPLPCFFFLLNSREAFSLSHMLSTGLQSCLFSSASNLPLSRILRLASAVAVSLLWCPTSFARFFPFTPTDLVGGLDHVI